MADCNVRNIDEVLMREMKIRAAQAGQTLRDWCMTQFQRGVGTLPVEEVQGEVVEDRRRVKREKRKAELKVDVGESVAIMGGLGKLAEVMQTPAREHHPACKCFRCRPPKVEA